MPLSATLADGLGQQLARHTGRRVEIERANPVGGGSINDCYRLDTSAGAFFVKVNQADRFPSLFEAEADGLGRLRATRTVRVPEAIAFGEEDGDSYLLLEHIEGGIRSAAFWERFGQELAALHRHTSAAFGLERDNYIGSLIQTNVQHDRWTEFFITQRLEPQVSKARHFGRLGDGDVLRFERLYFNLPSLFPTEAPALLHGDLWQGNFLCDASGTPVLIDPAVYYGQREMDLAMTKLFGGFDAGFYAAYQETWALSQGWQERVDLCNLYPLLVHANLFGGDYPHRCSDILRRYT